ncbi:MAG: hypothetical protein KZQ99_13765 [Candidatus Thiodiazotropha sp. (ex Dulcina madagascariensis)]|nr:hypothetical protein [Candidatus Thiodiazotropha sp. (ex Dulcina madagascariensis)]
MKPLLGEPYTLEEYTLDDLKRHPILVWSTVKAIDPDKKYLTPLLNSTNLTDDFNHAKLLMKINGTDIYAEASYNAEDGSVYSILVWDGNDTIDIEDSDLDGPISLLAVPEINGVAGVEFMLQAREDFYAYQVR